MQDLEFLNFWCLIFILIDEMQCESDPSVVFSRGQRDWKFDKYCMHPSSGNVTWHLDVTRTPLAYPTDGCETEQEAWVGFRCGPRHGHLDSPCPRRAGPPSSWASSPGVVANCCFWCRARKVRTKVIRFHARHCHHCCSYLAHTWRAIWCDSSLDNHPTTRRQFLTICNTFQLT